MRKLFLLLILLIPVFAFSQKEITLKKKYLGKYKGTIPAYKMDIGDDVIDVSASAIYIDLSKESIKVTIGNNTLSGTYSVMFKAKSYYLVDAVIDGQLATERLIVYKTGRKLSRDGMYPQPVTALKKYN